MSETRLQFKTIYGAEGEHSDPYMTRLLIGRLRLHIFHRGDNDPDPHNHPWSFWTFPLTSYVEEVFEECSHDPCSGPYALRYFSYRRVVRAFRLHKREAGHTHRVIGKWSGRWRTVRSHQVIVRLSRWELIEETRREPETTTASYRKDGKPRKIVTLVWRGQKEHSWGFLKDDRRGKWCWVDWRDYIFHGGKHAPCE